MRYIALDNCDKLKEQAEELLKTAEKKGLNNNFVFTTTYNRYLMQIELLEDLERDFKNQKSTIKKEYVKGRETIVAHPLISRINSTIDSANKTAALLVKILTIKGLSEEPKEEKEEFDL